jgi:hypothetical protein
MKDGFFMGVEMIAPISGKWPLVDYTCTILRVKIV